MTRAAVWALSTAAIAASGEQEIVDKTGGYAGLAYHAGPPDSETPSTHNAVAVTLVDQQQRVVREVLDSTPWRGQSKRRIAGSHGV
jgi:hypothetical protein